MKLEITKEQLELLEFIIEDFEYQDDEERTLIEGIQSQIYDVKEEDLLRVIGILKAQAKQPKAEWQYDRSISVTSAGCFIASSDYNNSITNEFHYDF